MAVETAVNGEPVALMSSRRLGMLCSEVLDGSLVRTTMNFKVMCARPLLFGFLHSCYFANNDIVANNNEQRINRLEKTGLGSERCVKGIITKGMSKIQY